MVSPDVPQRLPVTRRAHVHAHAGSPPPALLFCCCHAESHPPLAAHLPDADWLLRVLWCVLISMATSDGSEDCVVQRGRSRSDPSIITDTRVVYTNSTDVMDPHRTLHSGCLVSGVRTPPIRRSSKLASLGRIFKPWKWRKKKNEKLRQGSTALERKVPSRQNREDLVRKGLAEAGMESGLACGGSTDEPGSPTLEDSDADEREDEPMAPLASNSEDLGSDEDNLSTARDTTEMTETEGDLGQSEDEDRPSVEASVGPPEAPEGREERKEEPPLREVHTPPAKPPVKLLTRLGSLDSTHSNHIRPAPATLPRNFTLPKDALRGRISTPTGSPHLGVLHPQLPPSCIIEELHRALASKHRQDGFHSKEIRSSPRRRSDGRLSRAASTENEPSGEMEKKEAEENKENMRLDEYFSDPDSWNESVISGTLPRRIRKELLAVKLRNRPSKQELEDRNIFPVRSDQERQEIRQQIEMKLAKRLSQRPAVEELESRNILKQRNDQTEQEERREIKQRLNRKLNQRPTVDELRDRKILIRFSDYVEVAKAQDYDRRADKPWTRLSAADKAAIRKELNEFKSNEMEVHASSKHLTRFHRP
ncbi:phosphatase and actin regulator 3b isoform X1 [Megalobrama amblycephala]|uniref:phosphatase and actin regulator 3b isoform X1 n=2 Tax=Megalobrama amblycephala TaxID=75352 RepID=UPI00201437A4|nr:phosphatase and actin regulator 3b isoform X1 [Megalobrama amblycephala]